MSGAVAPERTVARGGEPLTPATVVEVAGGRRVGLAAQARERMLSTRSLAERIVARGDVVYGLTTGVGALKTVGVARAGAAGPFNQLMLRARGRSRQAVPAEWVRATMLVRAAGLAIGAAGVRPELAEAFCDSLNAGFAPTVHRIGSVGQADLSQMAEIGLALTGDGPAGATLAAARARAARARGPRGPRDRQQQRVLDRGRVPRFGGRPCGAVAALEVSAALAYEAFLGNVDQLHPQVDLLRPYPGHLAAAEHLRSLLAGGALATGMTPARALQDVLSFKTIGQVQGAARDCLAELGDRLRIELAASGDSPIMIAAEDRAISTGNHDATAVGLALDYARVGLANAAMVAGERVQKLLTPHFSGLASGLRADASTPDDALGILGGVGIASLVAEIRLLAAPTMLEIPTSGVAEGVEDRISLAPVGAARLVELAGLVLRVAAIELGLRVAGDRPARPRRGTWRPGRAARTSRRGSTCRSSPRARLPPATWTDCAHGWRAPSAHAARRALRRSARPNVPS